MITSDVTFCIVSQCHSSAFIGVDSPLNMSINFNEQKNKQSFFHTIKLLFFRFPSQNVTYLSQ